MDFNQLSGVVLLAQNEFSEFLVGKSSDRARLLERLTGLDLYTRLGTGAYVRHQDLKRRLEDVQRAIDAIAVLTLFYPLMAIGSLDGPGEDFSGGRFTGVTVVPAASRDAMIAGITEALAKLLVRYPGWSGWQRRKGEAAWTHADGGELRVQRADAGLPPLIDAENQRRLMFVVGWTEEQPGQ